MASHFVRWVVNPPLTPETMRVPQDVMTSAGHLPDKRRGRFLAARALLAQLMLRVYGIRDLPPLIASSSGRPCFADPNLPDFSISYAGNMVGVLLAEEGGRAGLDMEIVRAHSRQAQDALTQGLSSGEKAWINAQQDFMEAVTQIWTLRQSILKLTGEAIAVLMRCGCIRRPAGCDPASIPIFRQCVMPSRRWYGPARCRPALNVYGCGRLMRSSSGSRCAMWR